MGWTPAGGFAEGEGTGEEEMEEELLQENEPQQIMPPKVPKVALTPQDNLLLYSKQSRQPAPLAHWTGDEVFLYFARFLFHS